MAVGPLLSMVNTWVGFRRHSTRPWSPSRRPCSRARPRRGARIFVTQLTQRAPPPLLSFVCQSTPLPGRFPKIPVCSLMRRHDRARGV